MAATAPLDYAPRPIRRGAPWWLWALAALSLIAGAFWCLVPLKVSGNAAAARAAAARADVTQLRLALDTFKTDTGRYPTAAEGLGALVNPPAGLAAWHGPYVRRLPPDPWGRPYAYVPPAGATPPKVWSPGPDGTPGTTDDVASP